MYSHLTISDSLLVEMIKAKKREGAEALFDQYAKVLTLVLFRITGNNARTGELLEKSLVTIWLTIDQFNEHEETLLAWMIKIAKTTAGEIKKMEILTLKPSELPLGDFGLNLSM